MCLSSGPERNVKQFDQHVLPQDSVGNAIIIFTMALWTTLPPILIFKYMQSQGLLAKKVDLGQVLYCDGQSYVSLTYLERGSNIKEITSRLACGHIYSL